MIRYVFYFVAFVMFGCTNNNKFNKKTEKEEIEVFFKNFIKIKNKDYDIKKVKYVVYGDSLEFTYWTRESNVDTIYLRKKLNSKKSVYSESPVIFNNYKKFDFEDVYKYKRKNLNVSSIEYFRREGQDCQLMSINFLVFNEDKNRALIYYSLNCHSGYVEVYSKINSEWMFLELITMITP